jgi:putative acyl-CoA dehydrogenase
VQCLDVLRAMAKTPAVVDAYFTEVQQTRGAHAVLDRFVAAIATDLKDVSDVEYRARDLVDRLALALQASLLVRNAPSFISDAFCHSRLGQTGQHNYGTLPRGVDATAIIERATPRSAH